MLQDKVTHQSIHESQYQSLGELLDDYIYQHPGQFAPYSMPVRRLVDWAKRQTIKPEHEEVTVHIRKGK